MTNDKAENYAGQAWKEEYDKIQPKPVAPHYCHSTALQILPDGSISGNLARNIPEAIIRFRGQKQLRQTLIEDGRGSYVND